MNGLGQMNKEYDIYDLVKLLCKLIFFLFNLIIVKNITMVFPILNQKHKLF